MNVLASRSSACCAPAVTMMSSGNRRTPISAINSAMIVRNSTRPSLEPYCKAAAPSFTIASYAACAASFAGTLRTSGMPPERLIMSARLAAANKSRTALERTAPKRSAYRPVPSVEHDSCGTHRPHSRLPRSPHPGGGVGETKRPLSPIGRGVSRGTTYLRSALRTRTRRFEPHLPGYRSGTDPLPATPARRPGGQTSEGWLGRLRPLPSRPGCHCAVPASLARCAEKVITARESRSNGVDMMLPRRALRASPAVTLER